MVKNEQFHIAKLTSSSQEWQLHIATMKNVQWSLNDEEWQFHIAAGI